MQQITHLNPSLTLGLVVVPLMQLENGTQEGKASGKKEVNAGRGEQCSIEWLREWRDGLV